MKRKGLAFQLELVLVLLFTAIIAAAGFLFRSYKSDSQLLARQREMDSINIALSKYATLHHGAIPDSSGGFKYKTVTRGGTTSFEKIVYAQPGLFPKDLYALCDYGLLPPNFFGSLKSYTVTSTARTITTTYGNTTNGQYTYKVIADSGDTTTPQYTQYELSFKCSRFTLPTVKRKSY